MIRALITAENLALMDVEERLSVLSLGLPATYKECGNAVAKAVRAHSWEDLGTLSERALDPKRKPAHYHGFETMVGSVRGMVSGIGGSTPMHTTSVV